MRLNYAKVHTSVMEGLESLTTAGRKFYTASLDTKRGAFPRLLNERLPPNPPPRQCRRIAYTLLAVAAILRDHSADCRVWGQADASARLLILRDVRIS